MNDGRAPGPRPGKARRLAPVLGLCLVGPAFWGCAGVADYATAKPLPESGFEIAPHATGFLVYVPERFEGRGIPQHASAGATRHFFVRPQVGINVFGIVLRSLVLNAGMAAGASF